MIETALYLIPVQLSDVELQQVLPSANLEIVGHIKQGGFLRNATGQSTSTASLSTS